MVCSLPAHNCVPGLPGSPEVREIVAFGGTFKAKGEVVAVTLRCATEGRVFAALIVVVIMPNEEQTVNLALDVSLPLKAHY
jgi:hypothetical protein